MTLAMVRLHDDYSDDSIMVLGPSIVLRERLGLCCCFVSLRDPVARLCWKLQYVLNTTRGFSAQ